MTNPLFFSLSHDYSPAQTIAKAFDQELIIPEIIRFADGEYSINLPNINVTDHTAVIITPLTHPPLHDTLFQTFFLVYKLKQLGIITVHAIFPYLAYARQCLDPTTQKPGNAYVLSKFFESVGLSSILTVELHDPTCSSFYAIPFSEISLLDTLAEHIQQTCTPLSDFCIIAPDKGAEKRAATLAQKLKLPLVRFSKKRYDTNRITIESRLDTCSQEKAILVDDIIDTGSTALTVASLLKQEGTRQVYGYFVHPVFSQGASAIGNNDSFDKLFVCNTLPLSPAQEHKKIMVIDCSKALIEALKKIL